jgi:hypothetical protein
MSANAGAHSLLPMVTLAGSALKPSRRFWRGSGAKGLQRKIT